MDYNEGSGKTLLDIAGRLKINTDRLSPYNSWLLADRIPATGNFPVILRLTPAEYLAVKSRISTRGTGANTTGIVSSGDLGFPILRRSGPATTRQATIFYQINNRRGIQAQLCDNAITLAYYGGVSVPAFLTMNDLPGQDINLKPGEVYYLQRKEKRAKIPFHVVQQSQTLWDISAIYGIRLKSLLRYNRLKSNQRVQTGRIIWMQHRRPVRSPIEYQTVPAAKEPVPEQPAPVASDTTTIALPSSATPPPVTASVSPVTTSVIAPVVTTIIRKDSVTTKPVIVPGAVPASTPAASPSLGRITKVHVVKPGQTYFSISKLYGTTIEKLCTWNGLAVDEPLLVGQELLIDTLNPSTASPVRPAPTATKGPVSKLISPSASEKKLTYYFVKPKETIYRIALNHAVSVPDLMRWNGLKNFTIEVGQRLVIWQPGR